MTKTTQWLWLPVVVALLALAAPAPAQEAPASPPAGGAVRDARVQAPPVAPFETADAVPPGPVDALVTGPLRERGIEPAHACSDAVFVRRVFLDVIGALPRPSDLLLFQRDRRPDRRAALVDALLARDEFADYWSMKWCDLLRVKAEFPINLWPNGVAAYARWIRESLRENKPYDRFARELLTSSGSNFRVPAVNFYRAVQGSEPPALAAAVALTFLGVRIESWPEERRAGLQAFFSRLAFKGTAEWKEEIVTLDPAPAGPLEAVFPDGTPVTIPPGTDPRVVFADWLITPENAWFAQNIVNRVWSWLMGRGIIHEPDDIRPDNPPCNPPLLSYLQWELVRSGWDLRHLFRLILTSRSYQQSPIPQTDDPAAGALFAFYPVRRLPAEVLADAFRQICGASETYSSMIPEPFTFIPPEERAVTLADGSITSSFLELFGRPPRDTGLESERNDNPSDAQRMFLINASGIQKGLDRSPWLRRLVRSTAGDLDRLIRTLYLTILSRGPTAEELAAVTEHFEKGASGRQEAAVDLAWALINSKEFLYRH